MNTLILRNIYNKSSCIWEVGFNDTIPCMYVCIFKIIFKIRKLPA